MTKLRIHRAERPASEFIDRRPTGFIFAQQCSDIQKHFGILLLIYSLFRQND